MARFNMPDITIVEKSPEKIENEAVAIFESETKIKLVPADPRRKFMQVIIALLAQQRSNIDFAAKQTLLAYAISDNLDHLGVPSDTPRLEPSFAKTTQRFHLSVAQPQTIPKGTRVTAGDGVFFAVQQDMPVQIGQLFVDVEVWCTEAGDSGNGYVPGELNQLVDPLRWVAKVENLTKSEGGADWEEDDPYADRIRQAPEKFSVAGPDGAYIYWARTASSLIVDVSVRSPSPGVVEIRPLLKGGNIPGQEILDMVQEKCNDRKVRPLTDQVQVIAPEIVHYDLKVTYWIAIDKSTIATSIQTDVQQAIEAYKLWQKSKLGRDIDSSELIARIKNAGAKRVIVTLPAYQKLEPYQVAKENVVSVTYGGLEDD
ncbi:baseplate J/gp47 family protein [Brevibacillus porteri]|nr:baseplate J/gp47 family protein [Brevibacillus porteri]MED1803015.1 baseplate J/gp47 family protein [Brevibacillus porteri]MED2135123.1 baseplate J/gp47 family protein [Brevibacillus porteri]MED2745765.1 baseplate J/gp47 family protein [Brevibacillus porteri]MED2813771.1 baseplate J/gp47 family protein [Brevibacillus porteri]MED2897779.1 baseplate J/gp47 family protein [Brevibacillus porteri]